MYAFLLNQHTVQYVVVILVQCLCTCSFSKLHIFSFVQHVLVATCIKILHASVSKQTRFTLKFCERNLPFQKTFYLFIFLS